MSTFTLRPNSNFAVPFAVSAPRTKVEIESEFITSVYVMDEANLTAFRGGKASTSIYYSKDQQVHRQELFLPAGTFYLVIVNYSATPTAVHYLVSS